MATRIANRTYGTISGDQQKRDDRPGFCSGAGRRHTASQYNSEDLGLRYHRGKERPRRCCRGTERHPSKSGCTVHGGLAATMLDSCMGLAIQSTLEKGLGSTTLEFKISFVRPITPETGPIKAEGTVISRGRRVGTAEGRVTDSKGRLLVHSTTTCLIFES